MSVSSTTSCPAILLNVGEARVVLLGKVSSEQPAEDRFLGLLAETDLEGLAAPLRLLVNRQIHSNRVVEAEVGELPAEADGLVTGETSLALGIVTADCVPILLAHSCGPVAAVHAGWRGLAQGIAAVAVERLRALAGRGTIAAVLGPAIGPCCYEVGWPVAHRLSAVCGMECVVPSLARTSSDGRPHVDLVAASRTQLKAVGVADIRSFPLCTQCDPSWHSYRRDGSAGHNLSVIWSPP